MLNQIAISEGRIGRINQRDIDVAQEKDRIDKLIGTESTLTTHTQVFAQQHNL